ncbi:hypothetical protein BVY03_03820 [bacterium K02(2017)]|nr:hypothetical protein BVY03_03820 [bacterium K02(2017)]
MLEKYCDILVIGNELPGLITAAFLARRGLSVQVIDSDLFADHDKLPDPVCLCNLHSKLLRSILGRLNCPEVTIQNFLNKESNLQFIFPQNRIDIFNNPLNYFDEIEREFTDFKEQIKKFYENQAKLRHQTDINELFQQLIPSGWKAKRLFKKFIQEQQLNDKNDEFESLSNLDNRIKHFLKAQFLMAYQKFCDKPFDFQVSELFNPGDGEIFSVQSGIKNLKSILKDRITNYDGVVKDKVQIKNLLFRNGIFEGAELDETHGKILSKYVIWNDSLGKMGHLLPNKFRFRKLRKKCQEKHFNHHWFTARFTVDSKYIPEQMKSNLLIINDTKKDLVADNFYYLQVNKNKSSTATINVNFLLSSDALEKSDDYFSPFFNKIEQRLIELLPFSENSLKLEFPIKNDDQPVDTLFPLNEDEFKIFKHSASINGVSQQDNELFLDLFKIHYKTEAPNLYISHPVIFSAFGIESKLILGLKITDLIWHEVEKSKRRAMKTERRVA